MNTNRIVVAAISLGAILAGVRYFTAGPEYRCHEDARTCHVLPYETEVPGYHDKEHWGSWVLISQKPVTTQRTAWCSIETGDCYMTEARCDHWSSSPCEEREARWASAD